MLSARRQLGPTSKSVDGPAASRSWNGNTAQPLAYSYDAAKRPVSASASITAGTVSLTQSYDRGGNVAAEGRTMPAAVTGDAGSGTQSFSYDALSRLTGSSGLLAGSVAYTCGLDSGRASRTAGAHAYAAVYDRTGELASVSLDGGFPLTASYDAYGGLTSDPQAGAAGSATAYGYDLAGRTVSVTPAGASATSIALDALGRPRTRTTGSSADAYSYLGDTGSVVRVANTGGSGLTTDSVLDPAGGRLGAKTGTAVAWLAPDLHGSVAAALAKDAASVTGALRYDGYGLTLASWPSGGTAATSVWKYQGRLDLSPSSAAPLYDFGARDYAPGLGAFTSMDTVTGSARDPGQLGRFLYAEGNPASLVDPTGHAAHQVNMDAARDPSGGGQTADQWAKHLKAVKAQEQAAAAAKAQAAAAKAKAVAAVAAGVAHDAKVDADLALALAAPSQSDPAAYHAGGTCGGFEVAVGLMGGVDVCHVGDHWQLQFKLGASSGIGVTAGETAFISDYDNPSQTAGFGAGFGGSVVLGPGYGSDRSYSASTRVVNSMSGSARVGIVDTPEWLLLPAEVHAYGSFTIDFNDLFAPVANWISGK